MQRDARSGSESVKSATDITVQEIVSSAKSADRPSKGLRFWLIFLAVSVSLFLSALEYVSFLLCDMEYSCHNSTLRYRRLSLQPCLRSYTTSMEPTSFGCLLHTHLQLRQSYPPQEGWLRYAQIMCVLSTTPRQRLPIALGIWPSTIYARLSGHIRPRKCFVRRCQEHELAYRGAEYVRPNF